MTSKRNIRKRLSDLEGEGEGDTPDGEPLDISRVITSMWDGVDPRERHGGYIPADVAEGARRCFTLDLRGERDEENLTDEEWWGIALDNIELLAEDGR